MKEIIYAMAINEALDEEMARDEKVFILGEDVQAAPFVTTSGLIHKYGDQRVIDAPISENGIAGAVTGAAMAGYRPVADMYMADFTMVAAAEILMNAAKWHFSQAGKVSVPAVFLLAGGGGFRMGPDHSMTPSGILMHTPGLKVVFPSSPYDAKGLLKTAIRDNNPVAFVFHKGLLGFPGEIPEEDYTIPFGQADIKREGGDVTVVAISNMVNKSLSVAAELEGKIDVEVVDPRTLVPLDVDTIIKSVKKTGRVVIVDEDVECAGVTGEIAMKVIENAWDYLDAPPVRVAGMNVSIPCGPLEDEVIPSTEKIKKAILSVVE